MSTLSISLALAIRVVLVLLFLPFSALDKILGFRNAVAQAQEAVQNEAAATALILIGLRSRYVGGSCFRDCGSRLRIRARWLLCGDRSSLEAILAPRRLLEFKRRQGARPVLGFLEELGFGRWLSSHRLRNRCVLDRAVLRPSDNPIPSLPTYTGARTAVSTESSPVVPYWHVWTDADGISHQSRCGLSEFHKAPIQSRAAPQWIGAETRHDAKIRRCSPRGLLAGACPIASDLPWMRLTRPP